MKHYSIFLCALFFYIQGFTQDSIVLKNDSVLKVVVEKVDEKSTYYKTSGENQTLQTIENFKINKIIYKSGFEDIYNVSYEINKLLLKELKNILSNEINAYCFHEDSKTKHYSIKFEKDFILFKVNEGHGVLGRGILFDFSEVDKFYRISKRNSTRAYINILVKYLKNRRRNKWHKRKLIMRVKGHQNAYRIVALLKRYHELVRTNS